MFRQRTTFVLGAGFSYEVGLPLGSELKSEIRELLISYLRRQAPTQIDNAFFQIDPANQCRDACRHLIDALPLAISIDNIVEHCRGDEVLAMAAKVAIAWCILRAESRVLTFAARRRITAEPLRNGQPSPEHFSRSALFSIFQLITEGIERESPSAAFDNVAFVNFNYDRCLEHFLYHAITTYSRAPAKHIAQLIDGARIVHPYGTVGRLPWQADDGRQGVSFGDSDTAALFQVAESIFTYSESMGSAVSQAVRAAIDPAEQIVFLGFAYHPQNMRLVAQDSQASPRAGYGTVYRPAPPDPGGLATPRLEEYARPAMEAAHADFDSITGHGQAGASRREFWPLTALQLVERYSDVWRRG